jgi:hypothetical protein
LAFDPATVGLDQLPQPMRSAEDFQKTLALIETRLAEKQALLETLESEAAEAASAAGAEPEPAAAPGPGRDADAAAGEAAQAGRGAAAAGMSQASIIGQQIEVLRELRLAVQRQATLRERLAEMDTKIEQQLTELEAIETAGIELEPPILVSLLDQVLAEQALNRAVEAVAETRIETARRRRAAAERGLSKAVRERRSARDRSTAADADQLAEAERERLAQQLELARLNELLVRQQLAASRAALQRARQEDELADSNSR